uniref:Uncharacterized protein n=1 Tax=Arundo donax TaxID=35708 RepID=A0A0A8YV13_ARUDO
MVGEPLLLCSWFVPGSSCKHASGRGNCCAER